MAGRQGRARPTRLVEDIVTVGSRALVSQHAFTETMAQELMRHVAHEVCRMNAKCVIYVPQALDYALDKRDQKIWADYQTDGPDGALKFTGPRVDQLATEHGLSHVQIYNIIRRMKKLAREARLSAA
ncbi:UNVERIFIED_ORG: hypothetical protein LHJ69_00420 [Shinella sp. XGS7]|nr:Mor transcription activator family protein [Shinella sp. XGS7]